MKKRIWNQLKKAVMITAAVGILGAGAVSAAEFEAAELYVPAVGLKQSAQWIDEEKFQAELTLEVSGLKELYKSQQENTASENGQLQMENSTWDGEVREAEAAENTTDEVDSENTECESCTCKKREKATGLSLFFCNLFLFLMQNVSSHCHLRSCPHCCQPVLLSHLHFPGSDY